MPNQERTHGMVEGFEACGFTNRQAQSIAHIMGQYVSAERTAMCDDVINRLRVDLASEIRSVKQPDTEAGMPGYPTMADEFYMRRTVENAVKSEVERATNQVGRTNRATLAFTFGVGVLVASSIWGGLIALAG